MVRLVLTTFATAEEAAAVIRPVVEEKLAACGTVLPGARSIYHWHGTVEDTTEAVVLFKTTADRLSALRDRVLALHPYETPEWVVIAPTDVSPAYAAWVQATVGDPGA
jgi:periplasmic divalent cation tolerance protein